MAGPEKRRSELSILRGRRGEEKIGEVGGGWTKGKEKACWYGLCGVRIHMSRRAPTNGVRLPELVLWHSTLSDMVGRPLSRVLCVIIGGVIIWAGRASGDRHLAQLQVAAT